MEYFNYVVSFSDGTVKTGITSKPFFRFQDFIQEAHRHSVKIDGFNMSPPSPKKIAAKIETQLCESQSYNAIEGHREWFLLDAMIDDEDPESNFSKYHIFDFLTNQMRLYWKIENSAYIGTNFYGKIDHEFSNVIEFASILGIAGERISATKATSIAQKMIGIPS